MQDDILRHKRGATFSFFGEIPESYADGAFAACQLKSQVRDSDDNLVQNLTVEWDDPLTTRVMRITSEPGNTDLWPVGRLFWDVRFVYPDGTSMVSATISILCEKNITHA